MDSKTKPMFSAFLIFAGALTLFMTYYEAYPFWSAVGLSGKLTDSLMLGIYRTGILRSWAVVRAVSIGFCTLSVIVRSGSSREAAWYEIALPLALGAGMFFGGHYAGNGILT